MDIVNKFIVVRALRGLHESFEYVCTINLSYVSPTLHQSQSHFDFRRADFVALKVSLSCINSAVRDCPVVLNLPRCTKF